MATIFPARRYYEIPMNYGLWWEQNGTEIFPDSNALLVSSTGDINTHTEYARCAIQFKDNEADWVSDGDITEHHALLFLYLDSRGLHGLGTSVKIEVDTISAAWDMSSSQAHMAALATAGVWDRITPLPVESSQGLMVLRLKEDSSQLRSTYGIMLRIYCPTGTAGGFVFSKTPPPVGRAYFQYDIDNTVHADAVTRFPVTDDMVTALERSLGRHSIESSISLSDIQPEESDIDITVGHGSGLALISQGVSMPKPWNIASGQEGAISVGLTPAMEDYRGSNIITLLRYRVGQEEAQTLAQQYGIIGAVEVKKDSQDASVGDRLNAVLGQKPYYRDALEGIGGVNISSEPRLYSLLMVLINTGIPWELIRQEDLVWLMRRFGIVWDEVSYTNSAMQGTSNKSFIAEIGEQYALFLTRGVDDAILAFHPAWYYPSMEVWTIEKALLENVRIRTVDTSDKYESVTVSGENRNSETVFSDSGVSRQEDGRDTEYTVDDLTGIFDNSTYGKVCCNALARQLAGLLSYPHQEMEFNIGDAGIVLEVGNKLILASDDEYDGTTWTIGKKKGNSWTGQNSITAYRWPSVPAMQSTWEGTYLQGIWFLYDWKSGSTGANLSPVGSAGSMTVNTLNNFIHCDWRGPVGNVDLEAPVTFAPDGGGSSCKYDLVDFVLCILGIQNLDPHPTEDNEFTRILVFRHPRDPEGVVCGIHRVSSPSGGGTHYSPVDSRIYLGYTTDFTAASISWSDYVETAPGLSANSWAWNYGVAVQWHEDDVRLYVDGIYIGEISTGGFSDATLVTFQTPQYDDHRLGRIRWLQRDDDWFDADQMIGKPGTDEYVQ